MSSLRQRILTYLSIAMMAMLAVPVLAPVSAQGDDASPVAVELALPATVTDVNGDEVVVEDVSRIIPLNGNIAETVFALGLGDYVVAVDVSALYPAEALALPKIGYQRDLSAEGILSFEPTVVIGTDNAGPPDVIEQVRAAGVTVVILPATARTDGAIDEIVQVGVALGLPAEAEALAAQVESQVAEAAALIADVDVHPRVAFLYIRGEGAQMIAGSDTQAESVIEAAGGINVGAEIGINGYQPITPEALVEAAPDIILVMQAGLASVGGVDGLLEIPGIAQTPAGESLSIVAFEDLYLLGFGPRIGEAIYDLTIAFHPDVDAEPINPQWQGTDVEDTRPEASPES